VLVGIGNRPAIVRSLSRDSLTNVTRRKFCFLFPLSLFFVLSESAQIRVFGQIRSRTRLTTDGERLNGRRGLNETSDVSDITNRGDYNEISSFW
jgi:hypothetical protein